MWTFAASCFFCTEVFGENTLRDSYPQLWRVSWACRLRYHLGSCQSQIQQFPKALQGNAFLQEKSSLLKSCSNTFQDYVLSIRPCLHRTNEALPGPPIRNVIAESNAMVKQEQDVSDVGHLLAEQGKECASIISRTWFRETSVLR